jgi:DNA-directed RNA polymerase subunit beta
MTERMIERRSYAKLPTITDVPNLLEVQMESFEEFLQLDKTAEKRQNVGLQGVFEGIFPITDIHNLFSLEFVNYTIGRPKYDIDECRERGATYAAPLRATLRLIAREKPEKAKEDAQGRIKDVVEQQVYLGDLPIMTDTGTFVVNGSERVIVSQLHRSPGVFFDENIHPNGKRLFTARIIPYRGCWVEFTMDINDIMYVIIDRRRKLPVTVLLRALGHGSDLDILNLFYEKTSVAVTRKIQGRLLASDVVDSETGEVIVDAFTSLDIEHIDLLGEHTIDEVEIYASSMDDEVDVIENTLRKDPCEDERGEEDALYRMYALMRPGDPPNVETARQFLERLFFSPKRYDLGDVGRYRMNHKLDMQVNQEDHTLVHDDFLSIIKYLIGLRNGHPGYQTDDIDHLGNRRCRTVGELLGQQFSVGLSRMARTIRERMSLRDNDGLTPQELVNAKTVSTVIASFFGSSQLSQFMQQTNPLDELTHKRRLSALGPGGLTRDRAGFEVRDVHHTHYGRVCPIETPEGPNIGLIMSLATYARINAFGFIETPYRVVVDGKVTTDIRFLSSDEEDRFVIAQANAPLVEDGSFERSAVKARRRGDFPIVSPQEIDFMDVSPMQLVSAAAALIPFLEHDDANRALMGSNMQRQAVPLLRTDAPFVGTGMERRVAVDSGAVVLAAADGEVVKVDAASIVVREDDLVSDDPLKLDKGRERTYRLVKFRRSNQDCCLNQRPLVNTGDRIKKGEVLADGPATDRGDLALGYNVLCAFMPWHGYNFEDAIVIGESLIKQDIYTSIHIEEYELQVRDTKRGQEELTRDIPNVSDQALRNLDDIGVVRVGARVEPNDILVGKVSPKGETELSPEERLLRAIFGEKAGDVRDASLKAPAGMDGVVIDTRIFSRKERDDATKSKNESEISELRERTDARLAKVKEALNSRLVEVAQGKAAGSDWRAESDGTVVIHEGTVLTQDVVEETANLVEIRPDSTWTEDEDINAEIERMFDYAREMVAAANEEFDREQEKIIRGDELPPGVLQLVKVYIAHKRKLQVGDKMAGRHGNKGVVAKIVPVEDMPYLPDGKPVEIVLNPLGVPSRMNIGQVLETHLGWAAEKMGIHTSCPVFDGATITEIKETLQEAGLPDSGQTELYDGLTGDKYEREVTVGYIYILKLIHLVAEKIHARSIGPYSLVTQQPLGGRAQFGGQRFGEMEVWALEAYGASNLLQEMLTVKSDDVPGRSRIYESIVKGENPPEPGIPESFNVLVKELQALCLDVVLQKDGENGDQS